jgi:hypothetical protein
MDPHSGGTLKDIVDIALKVVLLLWAAGFGLYKIFQGALFARLRLSLTATAHPTVTEEGTARNHALIVVSLVLTNIGRFNVNITGAAIEVQQSSAGHPTRLTGEQAFCPPLAFPEPLRPWQSYPPSCGACPGRVVPRSAWRWGTPAGAAAPREARRKSRGQGVSASGWRSGAPGGVLRSAGAEMPFAFPICRGLRDDVRAAQVCPVRGQHLRAFVIPSPLTFPLPSPILRGLSITSYDNIAAPQSSCPLAWRALASADSR